MRHPGPVRFLFRSLALALLAFAPLMVDSVRHVHGIQSLSPGAYDQMARALPAGTSVWLDDETRPLKAAYIRQLTARKAVLILGSSRAAAIAADWFPGGDAWNGAVAGGGIDDDAALFEVCVEANRVPDTVILEIFPALMLAADPMQSLASGIDLDRALARYALLKPPRVLGELRLRSNDILPDLRAAWRVVAGRDSEEGAMVRHVLPDGRIDFFETVQAQTAGKVREGLASLSADELRWRSKSQPDEFAALLFRHFLDDLQSRGIHVVVFLAPVSPLAWDFFHARGGYDDAWIREELRGRGIPIAGTYSPIAAHAAQSDFYDALHPRPVLVRRLLGESGVISSVGRGAAHPEPLQ
jgi:hypothetical protein